MTGDAAPVAPLVVVMVGTDHHPFDRLVGWVDDWLGGRGDSASGPVACVVQHGYSGPPARARGVEMLDHDELQQLLAGAAVVVCHGGPSTIAESRRHGHRPIVLPRDPAHGEHVDDHQIRFVRWIADRGLVTTAATQAELASEVEATLAVTRSRDGLPEQAPDEVVVSVRRFGALVDDLLTSG